MTFAQRLRELRKKRGLSQAQLADLVNVHFTQISRYERGDTKPAAEAMNKLAQCLEVSTDYLMNGNSDDVAEKAGLDKELIARFKQVQEMDADEKKVVLSLLEAFIAKQQIQNILRT